MYTKPEEEGFIMKKKLLLAMALVGIMVTSLVGCGSSDSAESDLEYVQDNGTLKIGYTIYEPMNYTDENGEFTGFDTEFAELVCEALGVEAEFIEISWDSKTIELEAKNIDCIWNGMTITDELLENISISDPYVKNMQVLVVKSDSGYTSTEDLIDMTVAVEAGSAGATAAEEDENLSQAEILTVTKQTDALMEVKAGTSDAAVLDWTLASVMIGEGTDYADLQMVDGVELSVEEYGIGFRQDSDLKDEVDSIMADLIEDGTLVDLAEKYGLNLAQ